MYSWEHDPAYIDAHTWAIEGLKDSRRRGVLVRCMTKGQFC